MDLKYCLVNQVLVLINNKTFYKLKETLTKMEKKEKTVRNTRKERGAYTAKPKREVKKEFNPNHLYLDYDGSGKDKADIGEVHKLSGENLVFVADNGIKFKMTLSQFAQLQNVSNEIVEKLK